MTRAEASKFLRASLDANQLQDWHIRLNLNLNSGFLGLCSYKDKTIILNAHHVDSHPNPLVENTILHEVAHALCPGHAHDEVWRKKAHELGCTSLEACANFSLSETAIDAIRSGADLEITFEEEIIPEQKNYKYKYNISKLQDKCPTCGKVAKEKESKEVKTPQGWVRAIQLECLHWIFKSCDSLSDFESIVFDADPKCNHRWGVGKSRTKCLSCNAKRLYEYQVLGARAIEKANGRLGVFDEMGLGKTIEALAWMKFHPECKPFGWVTKSGAKFQHTREIMRVLGRDHFPQVFMSGKDTPIPDMPGYIFSYDIFRRLDLDLIKKIGIKLWVLDECQAIKNPDSTRTQLVRNLVREAPFILPLSGTPWKNRGSEFFVALNLLDSKKFWSFKSFKDRWVDTYWDNNRPKEGGIRNIEKFKEETAHIIIRRERKDVMPELPLVNRTQLLVEVPEHARAVYEEEADKIRKIYRDAVIGGEEDSFNSQSKVMQNLMVMRQIVGLAKCDSTVEKAIEFLEETERKLVIFVNHIECGRIIHEQLQNYCSTESLMEPLRLSADLNAIERMEIQDKFNNNGHRILVASTLASGEALNLQSCSDCIMMERQWNPANEEQAEGRFIRIGQQAETVNATYVHGENTIDTILDGIVERKRRFFDSSMNKDGYTPTWNEGSIVKELVQAIVNQKK